MDARDGSLGGARLRRAARNAATVREISFESRLDLVSISSRSRLELGLISSRSRAYLARILGVSRAYLACFAGSTSSVHMTVSAPITTCIAGVESLSTSAVFEMAKI